MASFDSYPSSIYRSPPYTVQDFCNGLNFATFSSFYQQLNPYDPPSLQYVQQQWIVLINELFPAGFDERERAFTDNPTGQKLKFQVFEHDGDQDIRNEDRALSAASQDHLRKCYKDSLGACKEQEHSKAKTESSEDQYSAERERPNAERKLSTGIESSYADESQHFTSLILSEVSSEADRPTDSRLRFQTVVTAGDHLGEGRDHDQSRRRHHGKRPRKQKWKACPRRLFTAVTSDAFGADAAAEEKESYTGRRARVPTSSNHQGGALATDQPFLESSASLGTSAKSQDNVVHFSFATGPERVDPCSLSQSELETAIAELLSDVQCEINDIHPDRAKMMRIY